MKEQKFVRQFAGYYVSEDFTIKKNYVTDTWDITRKSDKRRSGAATLKMAKKFVDDICNGRLDETSHGVWYYPVRKEN